MLNFLISLRSEKIGAGAKTRIASWLVKSSPEEKAKIFKAVPALKGAIIKTFIGEDLTE